jgi:excinuclease ABC subunit C
MQFLEGDTDRCCASFRKQMARAADNLQFELAALYRDRLQSAQRIAEQQKIISASQEDADYVAAGPGRPQRRHRGAGLHGAPRPADRARQLPARRRRPGRSRRGDRARLRPLPRWTARASQGALVGAFIQQFYDNAPFIPGLILVHAMPRTAPCSKSGWPTAAA